MSQTEKNVTLKELQAEASRLGIKGYSKMNKSELEAAIAKAAPVAKKEKFGIIGEVEGREILVNTQDTLKSIGLLLGSFGKGGARQVRKLLNANGFVSFSAAKRLDKKTQVS